MLSKLQFLFLLLFLSASIQAKIRLPSVLSSNMVLQQKSVVKLWGYAAPGAELKIITSWNNKEYNARSNQDGYFFVEVRTSKAGGPYTIAFTDKDGTTTLENILLGEVWFCSGQSNMEMPMKGFRNQPILNSQQIVAQADNQQLRLFTTKKSVSFHSKEDSEGEWTVSSPNVALNTSALAFQFGQMLQKQLGVPVGIIVSSWGGTPIRAWMSKESLKDIEPVAEQRPDTVTSKTPAALYNGMVAPFRQLVIAGFLWYQGENDHTKSDLYKRMMPAMVEDWRAKFGNNELPFYFVQIAPWLYSNTEKQYAPFFREMQFQLSKSISYSGMAVTMDIGSNKTIHPADKTSIADRLLRIALANKYRQKTPCLGPEYKSIKVEGNVVTINFTQGKGLWLDRSELQNFELAGEDRIFHKARAQVVLGKLQLTSDLVPSPVAARYAFKNFTEGTLFNGEGLPATSFRTDNWE